MPTIRDLEQQLQARLARWGADYTVYGGTYSGHKRIMGPHVTVAFPEAYPPNLKTRKEVYGLLDEWLGTLVEFEEQEDTAPSLTGLSDGHKVWLITFEFIS